jgi:hypothetical protein
MQLEVRSFLHVSINLHLAYDVVVVGSGVVAKFIAFGWHRLYLTREP